MRIVSFYQFEPKKGESVNNPSLTQPDLSLSVGEILRRFRRGLSTPSDFEDPAFYDEEDFPGVDFSMFDDLEDITDIGILKDRLQTLKTHMYEQVQENSYRNQQRSGNSPQSGSGDQTRDGQEAGDGEQKE